MAALDVTVTGLVLNFVQEVYGAKLLEQDTDSTPRAAENWLRGTNAMSVEPLADLLAQHPPLKQQFDDHIRRRSARLRQASQAACRARELLARPR